MTAWIERAERIQERLDALAQITDEPGMILRTFLSPAMQRANGVVASWMAEAGLVAREDGAGNLIGSEPDMGERPVLLLGSHLDTVRAAGRFDGPLGVLIAIEAAALLRDEGGVLSHALEIIGFSDEEGVRFQAPYIGSKALCGTLSEADLSLRDASGTTLREALESHNGRNIAPDTFRRPGPPPRGYVEVHIEQGPVLEHEGLAVGVVDGIAGQSRYAVEWTGKASHAGTTPFALRRDALVAAARFVDQVSRCMEETPGLCATVGGFDVFPNVSNVIPGRVTHTLDVRHLDDAERRAACWALERGAAVLAAEHRVEVSLRKVPGNEAMACDPALSATLAASVRKVTASACRLPSGAGHDGVVMASLCPIAMLFVRSRDGLSHHPDEHTSVADIAVALKVLCNFLRTLPR